MKAEVIQKQIDKGERSSKEGGVGRSCKEGGGVMQREKGRTKHPSGTAQCCAASLCGACGLESARHKRQEQQQPGARELQGMQCTPRTGCA